jgi:glycosyltransferase involved in cell wall biosynthesis
MKILQVIDSLRIGGSESLAASLAEQFGRRGIECHICAMGSDGPLRERLNQASIKATHLSTPQGVSLGAMLSVGQLALRCRSNVILTHHFRQLVHAVPAATLLRRKLVHVEHDYHSYEQRPDILQKFALIAPFVHKFVFVSDQIRDWFAKRLPKAAAKCVSIPNGIDTDRFNRHEEARISLRNQLDTQKNTVIVGTCARLEPIKDLGLLIQGFGLMVKALTHTGLDARLVLVGEGSQREILGQLVSSLGLEDKCHFAGVVSDVHNWLSAFDVYAITSVDEGLPLSVLEAMSANLPIVSVNVGSLASVVDDSVGAILKNRTQEILGEKLIEFCKDLPGVQARGARARSTIVERYSCLAMIEGYLMAMQ